MFTYIVFSIIASLSSSVVFPLTIPALLIRIVTLPKAAVAFSAPAEIELFYETSQVKIQMFSIPTPA